MSSDLKSSIFRMALSWGAAGSIMLLFIACEPAATWLGSTVALTTIVAAYAYYLYSSYQSHDITENNAWLLVGLFALVSLAFILFFAGYYYAFNLVELEDFVTAIYFSTATFTTLGFGDIFPTSTHGKLFVIVEAILGTTHMVAFLALFLTKFKLSQQEQAREVEEPSEASGNESGFSDKRSKPTASEYLKATESELLDRLNNNPGGHESEFPFIQSVIAVRTAESQRRSNESLVKQTRLLVIATWAICFATVAVTLFSETCAR